jgi:predicted TIM-barrel fold metal-dependent hydrolase
MIVFDGHVTIGASRDAELEVTELRATMASLKIDQALIGPPERFIPVQNRLGNELTTAHAAASDGALLAYAVASPWLGAEAIDELRFARERGARALKVDPALQGFDLLDGQIDPLVAFATEAAWPIYIRTGTPPHALPLQVAWLADRFPEASFLMGKSGATDFSNDAAAALAAAGNVFADSAYVEWPTALAAGDSFGAAERVVFTTDSPFSDAVIELRRVTDAPLTDELRADILGGTLSRLVGA